MGELIVDSVENVGHADPERKSDLKNIRESNSPLGNAENIGEPDPQMHAMEISSPLPLVTNTQAQNSEPESNNLFSLPPPPIIPNEIPSIPSIPPPPPPPPSKLPSLPLVGNSISKENVFNATSISDAAVKLKSTRTEPERKDARGEMLASIKRGTFQLRKVKLPETKPVQKGAEGTVASILQRRIALETSDSSSESGDEDDGDWLIGL